MQEHDYDDYKQMFLQFSNRVEKFLVKGIVVLAAALVLAQILLQFPSVRYVISPVDILEGIPYT